MYRYIIEDYLHGRGIKRRYKGFKYLVYAVSLAYEDGIPCKMLPIYAKVARRHNSTPEEVERAIRYAIKKSGYEDTVHEFLAESVVIFNRMAEGAFMRPKDMQFKTEECADWPLAGDYDTYAVAKKVCDIVVESQTAYELACRGAAPKRENKVVVMYFSDFKKVLETIKNGGQDEE